MQGLTPDRVDFPSNCHYFKVFRTLKVHTNISTYLLVSYISAL